MIYQWKALGKRGDLSILKDIALSNPSVVLMWGMRYFEAIESTLPNRTLAEECNGDCYLKLYSLHISNCELKLSGYVDISYRQEDYYIIRKIGHLV